MEADNPKTGQKKWKKLEDGEIRTALVDTDTTRQTREGGKQDPLSENETPLKQFELVWCHQNFIRLGGEELVYWTLGTQHMLTDPQPLKEVYFHGIRPFAIGVAVIEAHKPIPESIVGMGAELQKEVNETVNQRRDNVSLVLNKRYIVKRGAQVDTDSLLRNVPGGVTLANDPEMDIKPMDWPDVTSSSYQEQDRLNVDYDELTGNFSQGSVQTNRKLNETVGGMEMMGSAAGQMTEYMLRTIVETWMEPVLSQLVKLEQQYETDTVILALAGDQAQLPQKYGINQVTDDMLNQSLTVRVSMGMGATDPSKRLGRFLAALKAYGEAMQLIPDADPEAVRNEVFGLAGYKGGDRFFKQQDDPKSAALMQQMQEMQQALQQAMQEAQKAGNEAQMAKIAAAQANLKTAEANFKVNAIQQKSHIDLAIANNKPAAQAEPVDMKPMLDKLDVAIREKMLAHEEENAILKIENRELKAKLSLESATNAAGVSIIKEQHGIQQERHGIDLQKKDMDLKGKDAALQGKDLDAKHKDVQHAKEKDKEVEKKVAEKPDHTADVLNEVKALVKTLAQPKTKTATKDPKTGAWIVKES
jgi:hypothetical protein